VKGRKVEEGIQLTGRQLPAWDDEPEKPAHAWRIHCHHCDHHKKPDIAMLARSTAFFDEAMVLSGWNGAGCIEVTLHDDSMGRCLAAGGAPSAWTSVNAGQLAEMMLAIQARGCHNVLLRPNGQVAVLLREALLLAAGRGLTIPIAYHCHCRECLESLSLLDGLVDIYLYDTFGSMLGTAWQGVGGCRIEHSVIREMHRQVGELSFDANGLAQRGLLIRHPVLPRGLACTKRLLEFLAREVSTRTYLVLTQGTKQCETSARAYQTALRLARSLNLLRSDAHWNVARSSARPPRQRISRSTGFPAHSE
jgi:putative pyruvate formate lyase activating enzyme